MPTRDTPIARQTAVQLAADRILTALDTGVPCAPVRDVIGADDIEIAYAVQETVNAARVARGARVVGRKIGLTSKAVQQQLGVGRPDLGVLFDDMVFRSGEPVPVGRLLQPKVEAEIAFVLSADLVDGELDLDEVAAAVDYAVAAVEICDSRIANWDISFADTVADNASSGAYVLGEERHTLAEFTPRDATMRMSVGGQDDSVGSGADCLGDPLVALQWLARQARTLGAPLLAGQVVLSGALGPMRPAGRGARVDIEIGGLGSLTVNFQKEDA